MLILSLDDNEHFHLPSVIKIFVVLIMRIIVLITIFMYCQTCFGQVSDAGMQTGSALGGVADYDPSLLHFFSIKRKLRLC